MNELKKVLAGAAIGIAVCAVATFRVMANQQDDYMQLKRDLTIRENSGVKLNQQGPVKEVGELFIKKDFDKLEEIAKILREKRVRSKGGNWQLEYYYENLSLGWGCITPSREDWLYRVFDEWIKKKPESVTPRIAKAKAYIDFAWKARGRGYANTITKEGWKICEQKMNEAWKLLDDAERLYSKDPEIYALRIEISKTMSKNRKEIEEIFEKGIKVERLYCPLYNEMATTLMPRWHGKHGELEAFMDRAVNLTKDSEGESFYARISDTIFRYYEFDEFQKEHNIPYERIKAGYLDLLKYYPETRYYLNSFCYMACLNKDKKTARELLQRIGNDCDHSVWGSQEYFEKYKKWALTE
jgi:hypothetical protein